MNSSGIYEIVNTVNGKRYIGSAVSFKNRWGQHRKHLRRGAHHSAPLQRAWNKYGEAAFKFLPILTCAKSMLLFYEQQLLDKVKPEYNVALTAGSALGVKRSPESRAKMSAAKKGKARGPHTIETRLKIGAAHRGVPLSEQHKAKLSAAHIGKVLSVEARAKLSAARMGNTNSAGVHPSSETRARLSAARMGKKHSPETIAKLSAARRARVSVPK